MNSQNKMKFISLVTIATLFVAAFALPSPEGGESDLEARVENSGVGADFDLHSLDLEARDNSEGGAALDSSYLEGGESELEARQNFGVGTILSRIVNLPNFLRVQNRCGRRIRARPFYRFYNNAAVDHFYTLNRGEGASASGYNFEGVSSFIFPTRQPGTVPFFRLYSPQATDHFYTTSVSERNSAIGQGYNSEGIAGFIYPNNNCGGVPFYRLYSPSGRDHFYTTSISERSSAIASGYNNEGIAGYVFGR
ncbi:hypothetical protein H0H87_012788 [Tephrocybe sp. NHM501043]|nr:hypothetical protein H0H87_012788 [Tephrocybe sp. NHM501043]